MTNNDFKIKDIGFQINNSDQLSCQSNTTGIIFGALTGGIAIFLSVVAIPFVSPALRKVCLPYVPATDQQIINVLKALQGRKGKCVDLGSGDGRIVISIAKHNKKFHGTGIELNPFLIWFSRLHAWKNGVAGSTSFLRKDIWKFNLSPFDNIVIFGVSEMMPELQSKFCHELRADARVFACRFPLPEWKPYASIGEGIDKVWIYQKPIDA